MTPRIVMMDSALSAAEIARSLAPSGMGAREIPMPSRQLSHQKWP